MPLNPRQERFAQELAKGKTQIEAYTIAGYRPDDGAAARLSGNVRISKRVAELLEKAAVRAEITVASITDRLEAIAVKAEKLGDAPGLSVARAALVDAAKLNGLMIDRSQIDLEARMSVIAAKPMTDEEFAQLHNVEVT